jgi:cell division protease FtsH
MLKFITRFWWQELLVLAVLIGAGILLFGSSKDEPKPPINSYSALAARLDGANSIKLLEWNPNNSVMTVSEKAKNPYPIAVPTSNGSGVALNNLLAKAKEKKITVKSKSITGQETSLTTRLLGLIPTFVIVIMLLVVLAASGLSPLGRKRISAGDTGVTFDDVAGCGEAVEELGDVRSFLADTHRYEEIGARVPKGVLLYGPPGTGKTMLAKAVASEGGVPFYAASGSEFVEMFAGLGARRVRQLFAEAKKNAPSIVFIDELDSIGAHRSGGGGDGAVREADQTLMQLLKEMDGFDVSEHPVIVIAATNRVDALDQALTRPGRFDRHIAIDPPDRRGRREILEVHIKGKRIGPDVDLDKMARSSAGMSGADLSLWINEAALLAARNNRSQVSDEDVEEAFYRIVAGAKKQHRALSDKEREIVAHHEAGHALVGERLDSSEKVHKISIIPRGQSGGQTIRVSEEDVFLHSEEQLQATLAMLLAGREAENEIFGSFTSGAGNDLEQASALATQMITRLGMGKDPSLRVIDDQSNLSPERRREVDSAIDQRLSDAQEQARVIIENELPLLKSIAKALLEEDTLDRERFLEIIEHEGN